MKNVTLTFLTILGLCSCNGCESSNSKDTTASQPSPTRTTLDDQKTGVFNVIVLCDVSESVSKLNQADTSGFNERTRSMREGCIAILRHYPPGSEIKFYLIGSNAFERPILELQQPKVTPLNRYKMISHFQQNANLLNAIFDEKLANAENNTCILTSIENAYRTLEVMSLEGQKRKNELVIFSDMIEQCPESPVGKLMMDPFSKKDVLSSQEKAALNTYLPDPNWQDQMVSLKIIMTTPKMSSPVATQIQATWTNIFTKFGVRQSTGGKIHFQNSSSFSPHKSYQKLQ